MNSRWVQKIAPNVGRKLFIIIIISSGVALFAFSQILDTQQNRLRLLRACRIG